MGPLMYILVFQKAFTRILHNTDTIWTIPHGCNVQSCRGSLLTAHVLYRAAAAQQT